MVVQTMTRGELLALIEAEAFKTSITPSEFVRRCRDPKFEYESAHWFKLMVAADRLKRLVQPAPKPPPPPASDAYLEPARNLLVFASVTDDAIQQACRLPARWKFLFTADPAYRVTDQQIAAVKASGHKAYAWGDCRTTLPVAIRTFQIDRRLEDWYGQAESAQEFDVAYGAGAKVVVGNLSAITPAQLSLVGQTKMLFANELYLNIHPWERPDWRNANAGVGGNVIACYGSTAEGAVYTPVQTYIDKGLFNSHSDSVYCEGLTAADWDTLRRNG